MHKIITAVFMAASLPGLALGCGCVDAPAAQHITADIIANYKKNDADLARALANLGETVRAGYTSSANAGEDLERVVRLKKEQAVTFQGIVFQAERASALAGLNGKITAKSAEAALKKAEMGAVLKAMVLNQKSIGE